jgi:Lon-like protease
MSAASGRWSLRRIFLPLSVAILGMAAMMASLPVYVEVPGTPVSLQDAVVVQDGAAGELAGDFLLTTVHLRPGTPARVAQGLLDRNAVLVRSSLVVPPGQDERDFFDRQREVFRASVDVAAAVGLQAAGIEVDLTATTGRGVLVSRVLDGAPADGVLRPGDVITAVSGRPILVADELRDRLQDSPGEVELRFLREDGEHHARVEPADIRTQAGTIRGIGVEIQTASPRIELPVGVDVDSGQIGGPSAGLMMALTVYDKVAEVDLAAGRLVAGTGTLSPDGRIGPIGGIGQKVVSAHRAGADVFVSPAGQLEVARAAVPSGSALEVVGAATFDEALAVLSAGSPRG